MVSSCSDVPHRRVTGGVFINVVKRILSRKILVQALIMPVPAPLL
ncbi:hypothetical protein BN439_1564 [Erwinia amylovora Ea644]|nr:hypothetical protein BN439_1564 [Erwinia amylovora Ea644]